MKSSLLTFALLTCVSLFSNAQNRSYDGKMNNLTHPDWGAKSAEIRRVVSNGYADGMAAPGMATYPNPRVISNTIFEQSESLPNPYNISDYGWAFGQFIDHDITFVDDMLDEPIPIAVPLNDPFFDPFGTGTEQIFMRRSKYDPTTGTAIGNPRTQMNDITAWIDASNVYGSDETRANWLRTFSGGKLKTSAGNLLPFNTVTGEFDDDIDANAPFMIIEGIPMPKHFVAGDLRANEQPILTCMHTLWVREHNRLCEEIAQSNPSFTDEEIFQKARKMVGAYVNAIVYNEWLPALGIPIETYNGYDDATNPNIMNVFSAAAFRLGHTLLNDHLVRLDNNGDTLAQGLVRLKDAFFNPFVIKNEGGIEPFLKGMATQRQQTFDAKVVGDLRNFLFGPPGAGGLDLVAININRGRERGLPDYNTIRADFGMGAVTSFAEITSSPELQTNLTALYGDVNSIDPWVGMLSEDHEAGSTVGSTVQLILAHQYQDLRNGDRFYFENDPAFSTEEINEIANTHLSDIVLRNTDIPLLQPDIFFAKDHLDLTAVKDAVANQLAELAIFPNPAKEQFILSLQAPNPENTTIKLFSMGGQLLDSKTINLRSGQQSTTYRFPANTPPGIYLVVLNLNGELFQKKVVKN
ncbi:MAG: T9SS type A sorting domain-containing protein [Bacteroidetes bacterium]|nr:T9SS type A sorting domain-containing protein [Bacteroidota bacterium]